MKHFARAVKKGKVWWADLGQLQGFLPSRTGEKGKIRSSWAETKAGTLFTNCHRLIIYQFPSQAQQAPWAAGNNCSSAFSAGESLRRKKKKKGNKFEILLL